MHLSMASYIYMQIFEWNFLSYLQQPLEKKKLKLNIILLYMGV